MTIQEYPHQIESLCLELAQASDDLAAIRSQMRDEETETLATILYARDESGKALHSNDKARDVAFYRALRDSATYQQFRTLEQGCEARKAAIAAKLERLRKEFQIAVIEFQANHLGRRDAA